MRAMGVALYHFFFKSLEWTGCVLLGRVGSSATDYYRQLLRMTLLLRAQFAQQIDQRTRVGCHAGIVSNTPSSASLQMARKTRRGDRLLLDKAAAQPSQVPQLLLQTTRGRRPCWSRTRKVGVMRTTEVRECAWSVSQACCVLYERGQQEVPLLHK